MLGPQLGRATRRPRGPIHRHRRRMGPHLRACKPTGTSKCWGHNASWTDDYRGQAEDPDGQFTAVTAGAWHSCGIRTTGAVECWGNHDATTPEGQFTAITAGSTHTCGLQNRREHPMLGL